MTAILGFAADRFGTENIFLHYLKNKSSFFANCSKNVQNLVEFSSNILFSNLQKYCNYTIHIGVAMCAYFCENIALTRNCWVFPLNLQNYFGTGNVCDLHGDLHERIFFSQNRYKKTFPSQTCQPIHYEAQ